MVVPASSGGDGIEISINASDQASAIIGQVQSNLNLVATSAAIAQTKLALMGATLTQLTGSSLGRLAQLSQVFLALRTALQAPAVKTVFDQIQEAAQESVSAIQPLSSVIKSVSDAGGLVGKGFLGIKDTSVLDDIEQRFDNVSKKITGTLVDGFVNLPINQIPFVDKLLPPQALAAAVQPLDKALSDVVLDRFVGKKIPGALSGAFQRVVGKDLADPIGNIIKNSPLSSLASAPVKELLAGSAIGAIETGISRALTSGFTFGFVNANKAATSLALNLGKTVGNRIINGASESAGQSFSIFDRLLGGQASKFIDEQVPGLAKAAVQKSGAVEAVRSLSGELTNLISGSIVTGLTGSSVGGAAVQGLVQLVGDDLAAKGIKNLTGGVLVKLGEQIADVTQLTSLARLGFETLFTNIGTSSVKTVGSGLVDSIFGSIQAVIPAQVSQAFALVEGLFPQQVAELRDSVIDTIGGFVGGTINKVVQTPIQKIESEINSLNSAIAADDAREKIATLQGELTSLSETPLSLRKQINGIDKDLQLLSKAGANTDALQATKDNLINQLKDAEKLIEPRVSAIRQEIGSLNSIAAQSDLTTEEVLSTSGNIAPDGGSTTSLDVTELAKRRIQDLQQQVENLNNTPIELQAELERVNLDTTIPEGEKQALVESLTSQLAEAEQALQSPLQKVKAQISSFLSDTIDNLSETPVQKIQSEIDALNKIANKTSGVLTAPPIDPSLQKQLDLAEQVDDARKKVADLQSDLNTLQDTPVQLKEELVRVQLDTTLDPGERDRIVSDLTSQIAAAEDALQSPAELLENRLRQLESIAAQAPKTPPNTQLDPQLKQELDLAIAADDAKNQIAALQEELTSLNETPLSLRQQIDDIDQDLAVLDDTDIGKDALQSLKDNLVNQLKNTEALIKPRAVAIEQEIASLNGIAQQSAQTVEQVLAKVPSLNTAPTGDATGLVEQFEAAEKAREEIAKVRAELDKLQSEPVAIKEELVRVQLDTTIPDDQKQELVNNITLQLEAAEAALKNPVQAIEDQIKQLNQVIAQAPDIPTPDELFAQQLSSRGVVAPAGVQPQQISLDDIEAAVTAEKQIQDLQAQIDQLNNTPIELRAELERVTLDTTIPDDEKEALTQSLVQQITLAEQALQSPLQRIAAQFSGVLANASSQDAAGNLVVDIQQVFGQVDAFFEGTLSQSFAEIGNNAGKSFASGLGEEILAGVAPVVDSVDNLVRDVVGKIQEIPDRFTQPLDQVSSAFGALSGMSEPIELFQGLTDGASQLFSGFAQIGEQITFFQSGFETLSSLVTNGPFELLIGQNLRLNEQLLATRASLVATNDILDKATGKVIKDPTKAIEALGPAVDAAIAKVRKGSEELSGVTSSQLIETFQIVAQNSSQVGLSLDQSADTALSLAAAITTLGVPLDQASQEVNSILTAQISSDSVVAKSLGITNEMVQSYKAQGKVFDLLQGKLSAFRASNAIAANSISGITSNIQEVFENIALAAGRPLLEPITKELNEVYEYLLKNRDAIQETVSSLALKVFDSLKVGFDALQTVGGVLKGTLSQIPVYLFESLANFLQIMAGAAVSTVQALTPMINVFSSLFEAVRPLAGPFLQIATQAKVLQFGISQLGSSFGFLSNLLPGVGELMFGLNIRGQPLLNLFPALSSTLGQGGAGFLLLGQHMNAIPGLASQVVSSLGLFGPLAPVIAGVIPSIAGIGITVVGLAKNFAPVDNILQSLLKSNPGDLITKFKRIGQVIPGFSLFNNLLDDAALKMTQLARGQSLADFATQQFQNALKAAGVQLRNFVVSTGLLAGGLYLAFLAVDNFILKNEALMQALRDVVEGIQAGLAALGSIATSPFFTGIAVTIGVAVIAAKGLHLELLKLVAVQLASWASSAAGALGGFAGFLNLLKLGGMAQGAQQASMGLKALSIAMTQGTAASAQFLAANGAASVTLGSLQAALTATVARIRLFIVTTAQSAVTMARDFVVGVITASSALIQNLAAAIPAAIARLVALRATATGTSFSFAALATSIKASVIGGLTALKGVAVSVVSSLVAMATGAGTGAVGFGALATSIGATIAGLATLLLPITAVIAAVGLLGAAFQSMRLADSTAAVETYGQQTDVAFQSALQTAQKIKNAKAEQEERTKNGIKLSTEEYQANQRLQKQADEEKKKLDDQIATLKEAKASAVGNANKAAIDAQIASLEKAKATLTSLAQTVEIKPKELPKLGSVFEQLAEKARSAQEAINNSSGDPAIFKEKAEELIDITQQQLEQQQITAEEAQERLGTLANNQFLDAETQIKAREAIAKAAKESTDDEIATRQVAQKKLEGDIAVGRVSEAEGQRQITELRKQELQVQLEAAEEAHEKRLALLEQEFAATRATLAATLAEQKIAAELAPEGKDKDAKLAAVVATEKKIADQEAAYQNIRENQEEDFNNERTKLQSDADKLQAESAKQAQEAKLKEVEKAQKKAQEATKSAENQRLIQTQELLNKGVISEEQAAEAKVKANQSAIAGELQAEAARQAALQDLIKSAATPKAREELEQQLRDSRLKTQSLTLNSLEEEKRAQEAHIATVKAAIDKQNTSEQIAIEQRVNAGNATEAQAADLRADQKVKQIQTEIALEKEGSSKRLKLELELQQAIRAARDSEKNKQLDALKQQQTQEQTAIEAQINSGNATEAQASDLRADQKLAALQKEYELEKNNSVRRVELELEIQQAVRAARAAENAKQLEQIKIRQNQELAEIEKGINAGSITEGQAADLRADQKVESLQKEYELEKNNVARRAELEIEIQQAIRAAREAESAKQLEILKQQQTQEQIAIETQVNQGLKTEAQANTLRAQQRVQAIQAELALEGTTQKRRLELELELQTSLRAAREAEAAERKAALEQQNLAIQNQIQEQNQRIQQQADLYKIVSDAIDNRNRLLRAGSDLAKAQADFVQAELNILSQGETSELRKRQLAQTTAAIRLQSLQREQAFARESLALQEEQNRLKLEQEKIQNRIAQGEQQANIAKAQADIEVAKLDPKTTEAQRKALELKLQAEVAKLGSLQQQGGLIDQKGQVDARVAQAERQKLAFEQRSQLRGAQAELARSLPPGQKQRAEAALRQQIAEDLGAKDYVDLRSRGVAGARAEAQKQFGSTVVRPSFDGEVFDVQQRFAQLSRNFGAAAVTASPSTAIAPGTQPLALPQADLSQLGVQFENSGSLFTTGVDKLVNKLDALAIGGSGGQNINITLNTPSGSQKAIAQGGTNAPSLENVVKFAKQLAGVS